MNNKQKLIWILLGTFLVTIVGCKTLQETAQSKNFTKPEGVTMMTEAELRKTLLSNTYEGDSIDYPGSTYMEFIHPDGKISGLWNGKDRYKGEWAISGNIWCYKYKTLNGCNTAAKSGNTIYWYALDGTTDGGKSNVLAGDPKKLAQQFFSSINLIPILNELHGRTGHEVFWNLA